MLVRVALALVMLVLDLELFGPDAAPKLVMQRATTKLGVIIRRIQSPRISKVNQRTFPRPAQAFANPKGRPSGRQRSIGTAASVPETGYFLITLVLLLAPPGRISPGRVLPADENRMGNCGG